MTKIAVFGAGAIGGYMGAMIADAATADVSLVARGAHLEAIKANGLTLRKDGGEICVRPQATDTASDLGPQDVVIVATKAHAISGIVDALQPLLGLDTAIVFAVNGVPWWYFYGVEGRNANARLDSVDPGGHIWAGLGPERALGCVVYAATEVTAPGVITHTSGDRFTLGEPDGTKSERVKSLSQILIASGLKAPIRTNIRTEIWVKLWGNCAFNPLSVLTHGTLEGLVDDTQTSAIARAIMLEAQAVAAALDITMPIDIDTRIAGTKAVGAHKTSMLQDLELGRPMEIAALVTAVQELGRRTAVATPTLDMVAALITHRAKQASA